LATRFEGFFQRSAAGALLFNLRKHLVEQHLNGLGRGADTRQVILSGQAGLFERGQQLGPQFGAQIIRAARLAALKQLNHGQEYMLRGHVLDRFALQVMALLARRHALQVTGGTGVHSQSRLERFALEIFRVGRQQLLENTQLERQKTLAKQMRVQLEQFLQHRLHRGKPVFGFGGLGWRVNGSGRLRAFGCDRHMRILRQLGGRLGWLLKDIGHGMNQIEQPVIVNQSAASLAYSYK